VQFAGRRPDDVDLDGAGVVALIDPADAAFVDDIVGVGDDRYPQAAGSAVVGRQSEGVATAARVAGGKRSIGRLACVVGDVDVGNDAATVEIADDDALVPVAHARLAATVLKQPLEVYRLAGAQLIGRGHDDAADGEVSCRFGTEVITSLCACLRHQAEAEGNWCRSFRGCVGAIDHQRIAAGNQEFGRFLINAAQAVPVDDLSRGAVDMVEGDACHAHGAALENCPPKRVEKFPLRDGARRSRARRAAGVQHVEEVALAGARLETESLRAIRRRSADRRWCLTSQQWAVVERQHAEAAAFRRAAEVADQQRVIAGGELAGMIAGVVDLLA
jgi:hypothetical protein